MPITTHETYILVLILPTHHTLSNVHPTPLTKKEKVHYCIHRTHQSSIIATGFNPKPNRIRCVI